MSNVHSTIKLNPAALAAILASPQGAVAKDMIRRAIKVESKAKQNLGSNPRRVDTGRLRQSITYQFLLVGGKPVVRVGTNVKYAVYVHEGTGLYGPKHTLIRPKSKKALKWKAKKGSIHAGKDGFTYAKYSRGMRPNAFLRDALPAAKG